MSDAAKVLEEMAAEFEAQADKFLAYFPEEFKRIDGSTSVARAGDEGRAEGFRSAARGLRDRAAEFRKVDAPPTGGRLPLRKPKRVEAGQRWRESVDWTVAEEIMDGFSKLRAGDEISTGKHRLMLEDEAWTYLGVDSPPGGG